MDVNQEQHEYLRQLSYDIKDIGSSVARQEELLASYKEQLDKIYRVVIGNGSDDGIITRLILLEKSDVESKVSLGQIKADVKKIGDDIHSLQRNEIVWRNRVLGLGAAITLLNLLLVFLAK